MAVTADSYRVAFGKRLKHVIQATDMKYQEVANKSDVGINAVSKWANGLAMPSVFTFAKLCLAMNLDNDTVCGLLGLGKR